MVDDVNTLIDLQGIDDNRLLLDLPQTPQGWEAMIRSLAAQAWSLPMLLLGVGQPIGVAAIGLTNLRSRNSYLLSLFATPAQSRVPLALYIRHLFWNFPLTRLYVHIPAVSELEPYLDLHQGVGFRLEGSLRQHTLIGGVRHDVTVLGLLREEFESWCQLHEKRLSLAQGN